MKLQTCVLGVDEGPRDYLAQLFLGLRLVQQGFRVVLSSQTLAKNLTLFPNAVLFGKLGFRSAGQVPAPWVFQPAEGAFFPDLHWEDSVANKYHLAEFADFPPDFFVAWGEDQAKIIRRWFPSHGERIVVAGSERFDLCLPHNQWFMGEEVRQVKALFPDFILLATRFTTILAPSPPQKVKNLMGYYSKILDKEGVSRVLSDQVLMDALGLGIFTDFITTLLNRFPDETFVLRPHPSEREDLYRELFQHYPNLVVERSGNVLAWILASKAVITASSTVAVEAVIAGKAVVNLVPQIPGRPELRVAVASGVGHVVENASEGVEVLRAVLRDKESPAGQVSPEALSKLANLAGPAGDRIVSTLQILMKERTATSLPTPHVIRKILRRRPSLLWWRNKRVLGWDQTKAKYQPMSEASVLACLDLARVHGGTDAAISYYGDGVLIIEPA